MKIESLPLRRLRGSCRVQLFSLRPLACAARPRDPRRPRATRGVGALDRLLSHLAPRYASSRIGWRNLRPADSEPVVPSRLGEEEFRMWIQRTSQQTAEIIDEIQKSFY